LPRARCSCGDWLHACPFWQTVQARHPPGRDLHPAPGISRQNLTFMLRLLWPWPRGPQPRAPSAYGALLAAIHAEASQRDPRVALVVDTSKSVRSLDLLHRAANIDLSVVHIVRDGPAVAASYKKRGEGAFYGMVAWLFSNALAAAYVRRYRVPCLRVSYAALCDAPADQIARLNRFLGMDIDPNSLDRAVQATDYHSLAGSGVRRGTKDFAGIAARPSASGLSHLERWTAKALLAPLGRLFPANDPSR
jgi:hypothetical protein